MCTFQLLVSLILMFSVGTTEVHNYLNNVYTPPHTKKLSGLVLEFPSVRNNELFTLGAPDIIRQLNIARCQGLVVLQRWGDKQVRNPPPKKKFL